MVRKTLGVLALLALLIATSAAAWAEKRVALVIGNNTYVNLPDKQQLKKATADAKAMSVALRKLQFSVVEGVDLKRSETNKKVGEFANIIEPGDTVAFFFAGHGVRLDGRNYLLPSDTPNISGNDREFLKSEAIPVDRIIDLFRKRGARVSLLILDACRNDPFEDSNGRSVLGTRGLARIDPPEGTFVLFSAGTGQVALDRLPGNDPNPNSVFTRKLLPLLSQEGLEIGRLKDLVQNEVHELAKSVGHRQTPAGYDQVIGDFFLAGSSAAVGSKVPNEVAPKNDEEVAALKQRLKALELKLSEQVKAPAVVRKPSRQSGSLAMGAKAPFELENFAKLPPRVEPSAPIGISQTADNEKMEQRWRSVEALNSVAAYKDFISNHPNSTHAKTARNRLAKLHANPALWRSRGLAAYGRNNYAIARRHYIKAVQLGSTLALAGLGSMYFRGEGGPRDYVQAERHFKLALKSGNARTGYFLAQMYEQGTGIRRNSKRAAQSMAAAIKGNVYPAISQMLNNSNAWSKQFRRELQEIMREEGVYEGPIDGAFGPRTKLAIRQMVGR